MPVTGRLEPSPVATAPTGTSDTCGGVEGCEEMFCGVTDAVGAVVAGESPPEVVGTPCDHVGVASVGLGEGCGDAGVDDVEEGVGSDRAVGVEVGGDCVGGEGTGDGVAVSVGVSVGVGVGGDGVGEGMDVGVVVGDGVSDGCGVGVGVSLSVGDGVGLGECDGVGVGVGSVVREGVREGVGDVLGLGDGVSDG